MQNYYNTKYKHLYKTMFRNSYNYRLLNQTIKRFNSNYIKVKFKNKPTTRTKNNKIN